MHSEFSSNMNINSKQIIEMISKRDSFCIEKIQRIISKHGGVKAINKGAKEAMILDNLLTRLRNENSKYLANVEELIELRETRKFVSMDKFVESSLEGHKDSKDLDSIDAVTLEISWLQVFPSLMEQVDQAILKQELLPGRFILGKNMKEQEINGGLLATTAAMRVFGVSFVDMLDTNGAADKSNVHLGGVETLAGYFGGIGQPNENVLTWIDEFIYYYKNYGIQQVLNINYGTVIAGYILHQLGVDIEFKLSVFLGNDNPFSVLMNFILAKLFAREDGTTALCGLNFANSINNESIIVCSKIREEFNFTKNVRFEHHILQDHIGMVRQPFDRREELIELAKLVPNISAKHEGGEVEVETNRLAPSTVFDLFLSEKEIKQGAMLPRVTRSYLDKHDALNN